MAEGRAGLEVLWPLLFALLLPFTNTGLLTCILYMQTVEGTQLNKSDIVMRVSGQHEVVSVGDAPGWDTGMKPYPEMPSQIPQLWDGWCRAGKSQALILQRIFASRAGECRGGSVGPGPGVAPQCRPPGPAGGCGVAETGGKGLKGASSFRLRLPPGRVQMEDFLREENPPLERAGRSEGPTAAMLRGSTA